MKKKKFTKEEINANVVLVFAIIIMIIVFFYVIDNTPIRKSMDLFCQEQGYEDSTDHKRMRMGCDWDYKVECDQDKVFIAEISKSCVKWNKWGDCITSNEIIVQSDGGTC